MSNLKYNQDYRDLGHQILNEGVWVENQRTGTRCKTIIGATLKYDVGAGEVPLLSDKQSFPLSATAELLGYLRGYTNAGDFARIGSPTWFGNANENEAWLNNPHRKGENDMGKVYGAIGRDFGGIDQLEKVYNNLKAGIDDRGETITFWKPDDFDKGCLRPCMRTHTFSIIGDTLHLTSESRSVDYCLGLNFNSIQCYVLLSLMAKLTGLKAGIATHHMINVHIYEEHIPNLLMQMERPIEELNPSIDIKHWVGDMGDVVEAPFYYDHAREYVEVNYKGHQGKINFNMVA